MAWNWKYKVTNLHIDIKSVQTGGTGIQHFVKSLLLRSFFTPNTVQCQVLHLSTYQLAQNLIVWHLMLISQELESLKTEYVLMVTLIQLTKDVAKKCSQ